MKQKSVRTNFILNVLRVVSTTLVGLIMMPYVNKVLGVNNIGKIEYSNTIINYFVLFSALGIPVYGIREIAKLKNDRIKRTQTVVELFTILMVTTLISYLLLSVLYLLVPKLGNYNDLLLLLSSMVFLSNIGAEWYFQGMENQKFITIRYLIVRVITLILVFLLVETKDDYIWYALILVLNVCGSNLFNLIYLAKDLNFEQVKWSHLDIKRHLKPIMTIFIATISINIYLQLDILLIGSIVGDRYVGLYAASNKLVRFVIIFVTIIGSVLLPRLSTLFVEDKEKYIVYLKKGFNHLLIISIPCTLYIFFFAEEIIYYLAGKEFSEAVVTVRILSPLCIVVGMAYFLGYLVFYVQGKEKIYTSAVVISAILSVILNLFVIKIYFQNGAAVVAVLAEFVAVVFMFFYAWKFIKESHIFNQDFFKIVFINVIIASMLILIMHFFERNILNVIITIILLSISYILLLYFVKEKTTKDLIDDLIARK